ncbi:MAG: hypothetical protein JWL81_2854 [Verrucomicrobiales bacterium]|nr:hypothetical protein [Verrucomicrobiales bacterium]
MNGTPPLTEQRRAAAPASQWSAGLGQSLRKAEVLHRDEFEGLKWELRRTPSCVWMILTLSPNIKLGIRAVFCPTGLIKVNRGRRTGSGSGFDFTAQGGVGDYSVTIRFMPGARPMLRATTRLTPGEPLRVTAAPRDLCVLDPRLNPYQGDGRLYTCQTGSTAGQSFFSALEKPGASVFYFQNFTALADYFQATGSKLEGSVQGEWPEAGFGLPAGPHPLKPGKSVIIADAFVECRAGLMPREVDAAMAFLDALVRIYPLLPKVERGFHDWPAAALKTMRSLTSGKQCTRSVDGKLFVEAYVGSTYKPPEGMVQGALMVPLLEYAKWRQQEVPLLDKLKHVPDSFFNSRLRIPVRWLPGGRFTKSEPSEEEVRWRMDSWYLLHTLMNLGRMGEMGMENARRVFLGSLDTLISVARHFDYDWPVFYDQRNLKVFKRETRPGEGGEQDADGLYVHIMMQAYELTHESRYLEEAETGALKMKKLSFGVLYQTNNTVVGAVALARLWRATGKLLYRDLSLVSLASTFSHLWLWSMGADTRTYMGLPPLHDAPYLALYEEAEILAALQTLQAEMREELPASLAMLCAEYQKHLLQRGRFYFPSELPPELVTREPKEGVLIHGLHIPLEGLGTAGEKAGTVGQAVYAAAAPFILAARCWHRPPEAPFIIHCDYPLFDIGYSGSSQEGTLNCRIGGDPGLSCRILILPLAKKSPSPVLIRNGKKVRLSANTESGGHHATLPGDSRIAISWIC